MLKTTTFPQTPESNVIGAWRSQATQPGLRAEWAATQRGLGPMQWSPKSLPSPDMTPYWLMVAAAPRAPWYRALRATEPERFGPHRGGSYG
jgi:hypothetical protein